LPVKSILLNRVRSLFKFSPIEKCLAKLSQGKTSTSLVGKLLPSHYLYKKGSHRVVRRYGLNFNLDISDLVDWHLYYGLKETEHEKLYALCKEDFVVMDIGTNNGAVLMQLCQKVNNGFVYGFEPDPTNFVRCQTNVALNDLKNLRVNNIGLGKEAGRLSLVVVDETNMGMNKISSDFSSADSGVIINTVDNFIAENAITRVDLVKIDTEGFELNVLLGAAELLRNMKPILFIELDDNNLKDQKQSAKQLISYLEGYQYRIERADTGASITSLQDFTNCHFDIIAR
jgi:FkbM family methyltransferase